MNFTFRDLKTQTRECSKEKTGRKINLKKEQYGPTQTTRLFRVSIKNPTEVIAKRSGAGALISKMILPHVYSGQQKILMNAITHRSLCWQAVIISPLNQDSYFI